MFFPPVVTPIIRGQTEGFSTAFNDTGANLRAGLLALRDDLARQNIAFYGGGRFVSTPGETNGDTPTGGAVKGQGLSIQLPSATWMVDGFVVSVDALFDYVEGAQGGYVSLDVEAGGDFWVYISLLFDPQTGYSLEAECLGAKTSERRAQGKPCVAKVTTGADSVLSIDHSHADVIWSMAMLQNKITALGAAGSGTGGSGGSGGPFFLTQIVASEDDATSAKDYIDQKNAEQDAKLALGNSGTDSMAAFFDKIADEAAINRAGLAEVNPHAIERGEISVVVREAGHGQDSTPDYTPDTLDPLELAWDADTGLFG